MEEIFSLVARELKKSQMTEAPASGVTLTGGGALLDGAADLAEQIFDLPAKVASPRNFENNTDFTPGPAFSTGVGLIHYCLYRQESGIQKIKARGMMRSFEKIKRWFNEYF
jgi:cell division protein FtsA